MEGQTTSASTTPFLKQVVQYINHQYGDKTDRICIVLPNRRASVFLKQHFNAVYQKTIWLPDIFSTEDFISHLSPLQGIDPITQLFEFYLVYKKIQKTDPDSFDDFSKWAPILLQDFNEIDQYLIDSQQLFSFVNEKRAIEIWNPGKPEPTPHQKDYLKFWESLHVYYSAYKKHLSDKNMSYQGMAFRSVAENISKLISKGAFDQWDQIIFAGFNAFNQAEEKIVEELILEKKCKILWDSDEYYMNDQNQEAGIFLRKYRKKWNTGGFDWVTNAFAQIKKNINVIGVAGNVNQTKVAGDILQKLNSKNYQDVALVLANEGMLLPALESLPDKVQNVNVTMGYPLKNTPIHSFWVALLTLHENGNKYGSRQGISKFHHADIFRVLKHQIIRCSENEVLINHLIKSNQTFIESNELISLLNELNLESKLLKILFSEWKNNHHTALQQLESLIELFRTRVNHPQQNQLELEYLFGYAKIIQQLKQLDQNYDIVQDIKTTKTLFNQLVGKESIAFFGEPLKGLQLMGMLETRTLDFDSVILLSTNEGTLPAGKTQNSFIPFEVKQKFKLPTHVEKDAIFAYHFYHLIQRPRNIYLIYNTDSEDFGNAEKSRFIAQLEYELKTQNPKISYTETTLNLDLPQNKEVTVSIQNNQRIIDRIKTYGLQSGFSPSALNTFIQCPLDFYYRYVLKVKETTDIEEVIEANTLGTITHQILENLYLPFISRILTVRDVEQMLPQVEQETKNVFKTILKESEFSHGKNFLTYKIVIKQINSFLHNELTFLKKLHQTNQSLTIMALEKEMQHTFTYEGNQFILKGNADRIDKIGNTIRIIDYKTGLVEQKHLMLNDLENITTDPKLNKSFQLLVYALLFFKENENYDYELQSGNISFRKLSDQFMPVIINKQKTLSQTVLQDFEEQLLILIKQLLDESMLFTHNNDAQYCTFC